MVLEEASSPQEPSSASFSEHLPSSDIDPYSGDRNPIVLSTRDPSYVRVSPQNATDPVYVNLSTLPQRWGFLGPRAHPPPLVNAIVDSCKMASQMLGRPVKQDEADALAYHFAKSVRIGSYGTPIGVSLAMVNAYRTMSTYRFPGWTPGDKWRAKGYPDVFGPLKGQRARVMWQLTRFNVYAFLGAVLGQVFFGSYALTVGSAGRMMDPRLKELSEKIRDRAKNGQGGELLPGKREVDVAAGPRQGETLDMARQRQRVQEGYKRRQQKSQDQVDDMSPTGGAFVDEYTDMGDQGDTGWMSDRQVSQNDHQNQLEERNRRNEIRAALPQNEAAHERAQKEYVDDASSMASSEPRPKQRGSAWERLRQQATAGAQSRGSQASESGRDSASSGSNYNSWDNEERRQLAKSESQKIFDARIEREREGRDFDDQGSSRGGWRK